MVIGGPGTTVEVDESLFSRRKNHQGRVLPQKWVFGGICRETRESFMYAVPDRSAPDRSARTLLPIIQASIAPGTTIMSDIWAAYGGIEAMGFAHLQVKSYISLCRPKHWGAHAKCGELMEKCEEEEQTAARNTSRHARELLV